ncbi:Uncharacterized protein C1orf168 [Lonchura striata]|uniref:Uncharacterized protein C1orf168 n=1 Tax=Lonchura striata TaxID=40157 RepID=A0A218UWD7_9PASE|nr:Uncharacterized protein C1orf168 [Lonchura striata domestica]
MELEGVTDFKALRAKFQNDSNLANKPGQKPPAEISPKPGSAGSTTSSPLPRTKREVKVSKPAQTPVLPQHSPLAQPQGPRERPGHSKEHTGSASERGLSPPRSSSEKPLLSCGIDQQGSSQTPPEDPQLPDSFQHVLQIWEETLSRQEKTSPRVPAQRAGSSAPAASGSARMAASGSSPVLDWCAQRKDALRGRGIDLPRAPRGDRSSAGAGAGGLVASAFCQSGYCVPREPPQHQKELEPPFCQPGAGKWSYSPGSKWPRIKPLPSAESLGPAPGKPPRPPKVDLSAFQSTMPLVHRGNETTPGEEDYLTPESAQLEEQNNYEETPMYLNQSGDTTTLCVIEGPKAEPQKHRTGGNEYLSPTSHARAEGRGVLKVLQGKQDVTSPQNAMYPTPPGLAKDRAEHWHSVGVGAPKPEGAALGQNPGQSLQAPEDIYDDIEELHYRLSHGSDASSSFTSDSISGNSYEETYEDVEIGGLDISRKQLSPRRTTCMMMSRQGRERSEGRMTSTRSGCQNFGWRKSTRTKGKASTTWKEISSDSRRAVKKRARRWTKKRSSLERHLCTTRRSACSPGPRPRARCAAGAAPTCRWQLGNIWSSSTPCRATPSSAATPRADMGTFWWST